MLSGNFSVRRWVRASAWWLLLVVYLFLPTGYPLDEVSESSWRTWSDASGRFRVTGRLVAQQEDTIQLEVQDGRIINVAIDRLASDDRDYLRQLALPADPKDDRTSVDRKPRDASDTPPYNADAMCDQRRVEALMLQGLRAKEPEVKLAAIEALLGLRENVDCANEMLSIVQRQFRAKGSEQVVVPTLAVLLSSESQAIQSSAVKFLSTRLQDAQLAEFCLMLFQLLDLELSSPVVPEVGLSPGSGPQPAARNPLHSNSGHQPLAGQQPWAGSRAEPLREQASVVRCFDDEAKARTLHGLTKTVHYLRSFPYRRIVIRALTGLKTKSTVPISIDALSRTTGEARGDIISFLTAVTQQHFGLDVNSWQDWWDTHGEAFALPENAEQSMSAPVQDDSLASYHGLSLYADRIIFVLDTSGSMTEITTGSLQDTRIALAKRELIQAIANLSPNVSFNIVIFSSGTSVWQRALVPATPDAKLRATQYVGMIGARGLTVTGQALKEAFRFDVEAIYLLSDGMPSENPQDILWQVARANRQRMISIYSIGLSLHQEGRGAAFLQQLSAQNFGEYIAR